MEPVPEILGTQTVIYWKGQSPVCHDCKVLGHWKKACNSTLRAMAHANKLAKIPPAPIQTDPLNKNQPEKDTTPKTLPEVAPEQSTSKQPEAPTAPIPPVPSPAPALPKPTTTIVRESEIIEQSRQINVATGSAPSSETVVLRDTEGWTTVDPKKKKKNRTAAKRKANESSTEASKAKKVTLGPTAIEISSRPRTVGNQLQYYLYMMEHGHLVQSQLQTYINKADPVTFITATKPSMKPKSYEQFTNWVGRRRRQGKTDNDDMQDMAKWKVSLPDFMNPSNQAYIDTSISAKQYYEKEEQRKAKPGKLTVRLPAGISPTENEQVQEVTFRPKDKMTTVLKNIKKAFKLGIQVDLLIEGSERALNLFVIADKAGLKDGCTIVLHRTNTGSSSESPDPPANLVTVRIQHLTSSKVWTQTLPETASTTHLYYEFQTHYQYTHGSFTLLRSDGSRISRFTTLGNLHLRRNEVLIYRPIDSIMIDASWLDNERERQNKCVYVEASKSLDQLRDILKDELLLTFNPIINIPNEITHGGLHLDEMTESGRLVVHLRRVGQETWEDTTYDTTPDPKQITAVVMGDTATQTYTMELDSTSLVVDFAIMIYKDFPEHKGKVLEDLIGLPYELSDLAERQVPASGLLTMRVSPTLEYTQAQIDAAITAAAAIRSTTVEELLNGPFLSLKT
jgi:hypothetical protein